MGDFNPTDVLEFWFPDSGHWEDLERHSAFWTTRMQGGMDATIIERFGPLTEAAARGALDHWADTPRGRLALLIALDQFPRSYWRDTPAAYAQDIKATRLALEGIANGHYDPLRVWEKQFFIIAISHCEGPDHLERMDRLIDLNKALIEESPDILKPGYHMALEQAERVRGIIARFGRHPHRNPVLGRPNTIAEEPYLAEGKFPHERALEDAET